MAARGPLPADPHKNLPTKTCIDLRGIPADVHAMRSFRLGARWASTALSALLLASSLTCLTAACRTLCGGESVSVASSVGAEADLPPCHGGAAPGTNAGTTPAGACDVGSACCAKWLNDHATLPMPDPDALRTLLPVGGTTPVGLLTSTALAFATDPPDLGRVSAFDDPAPPVATRAATGTRGPPRTASAA